MTEAAGGCGSGPRTFSAGSCRAGDGRYTEDDRFGNEWEQGSEGDQRFISRVEICERFERLCSEASKVLERRENEREETEEEVANLQEKLRGSKHRDAQTAARLVESREVKQSFGLCLF